MALAQNEVRKGLTGHLYMAPIGTTMPTDVDTPLSGSWVELGYTNEDGVSFTGDTSTEGHTAWQSRRQIRSDITEQTETLTFMLWQTNADNLKLAYGGGTVVAGTGDNVIFTPPSEVTADDKAFVFESQDGDIIYRFLIFQGSPTLSGDVVFNKSDITGFEMEVVVLDTEDGPWQLITNDPNIEADA